MHINLGPFAKTILELLLPLLATAFGWLAITVQRAIQAWASQSKNSTVANLAAVGVRYAETKFGPDSASGAKKREEAINFLVSKTGISAAEAASFVDAAYHAVFTAVGPLAPAPTSSGVSTPATGA